MFSCLPSLFNRTSNTHISSVALFPVVSQVQPDNVAPTCRSGRRNWANRNREGANHLTGFALVHLVILIPLRKC